MDLEVVRSFDKLTITTNGTTAGSQSMHTDDPTQATHSQPVRPEPVEGLPCYGPQVMLNVVRQAHHERNNGR